jgi:23S rRNA (guanosine2251-2'-O)-methyltransferase
MEKLKLADLNRLSVEAFHAEEKLPVVLVLDNVRSGLNVGSIFRTADAFRLERIVLCGITAQPPHREILKTALGSTESVSWAYVADAAEAVDALKHAGYSVWACEQTTNSVLLHDFGVKSTGKYAFVLGNEVDGVGEAVLMRCDGAVEIPQFGTKHSLNVAVAGGIVVWEAVRQLLPGRTDS